MRLAVLVGALAAAVLLAALVGLRLLRDEEPAWSERASAACDSRLAELQRASREAAELPGIESRTLSVYGASVQVEGRLLSELEALPRPEDDRLAIARVLSILRRSHGEDEVVLGRLRSGFDRRLLEGRLKETTPVLADVRRRFGALGAAACARFYDPASFR